MGKAAKKPLDEEVNMGREAKKPFNRRKFVSLFVGFSFVLMTVTGFALFFAPSCRIARDTSWAIWGHNKEQFVAVHVWFSTVFVIAAGYHIYLHWTVLEKYFKTKVGEGIGLRTEWVAALLICLAIYVGTVRTVWPFQSLIDWQDTYKHGSAGSQAGQSWRGGGRGEHSSAESGSCDAEGQPGHGRGSCEDVEGETAIQRGRGRQGGGQGQGANLAGRGMGQMTLSEFCQSEGIELTWAIRRLRGEGFAAQGAMTIREIADGVGVHPRELRDILGLEGDCDH